MTAREPRTWLVYGMFVAAVLVLMMANAALAEQVPQAAVAETSHQEKESILEAVVRLPLAAVLGAALAMRPRRAGTPRRRPAVVQTQIILAVVGALVMIVVGASLARAFGVVGIAGLVRYRAKIEDPKDAGVMLAALGVGLAAGVGLYWLSPFATVFLLVLLYILETSEPEAAVRFLLKISAENAGQIRRTVEGALRRQHLQYELRSWSSSELHYAVEVPLGRGTDAMSKDLVGLGKGVASSGKR